jgi:putative SOS response-associated peptidase YedK
MCGRFALALAPEVVRAHFGYAETPDFPPRHNIAPTQPIALVVGRAFSGGAERSFMLARWGLLPSFVREPFPLLINARAEGIMDKPSFAPAFRRRRCLVPADGFYVFATGQPYWVAARDGAPLGLAGLYETYLHPNGSEVDTACIVTIAANALLAPLNERMPVIVSGATYSRWLDGDRTSLADAQALLRAAPETLLQATPVSRAVGDARAQGPALREPVGPSLQFVRPVS